MPDEDVVELPRAQRPQPKFPAWFAWACFLFLLAALLFLILVPIYGRPVTTSIETVANNLQNIYETGSGSVNVNRSVVPFTITAPQPGAFVNAATFGAATSPAGVIADASKVIANSFQVTRYVQLVSLQVIAQFVGTALDGSTERQVGVFNLDTRQLLAQAFVSDTDNTDGIFYIQQLLFSQQPTLVPFVNYAVCSNVVGGIDSEFVAPNSVFPSRDVVLIGRATLPGTSLQLPNASAFAPIANNLGFGSFQTQFVATDKPVFTVSQFTGFATFPPSYVYNLNVSCNGSAVFIEPGVCTDSQNITNMVNTKGLTLQPGSQRVPNGVEQIGPLQPSTYYAVYLMSSSGEGLPICGYMSQNLESPIYLPTGYDTFRRVGWAYVDQDGALVPTFQVGNGPQRETYIGTTLGYTVYQPQDIVLGTSYPVNLSSTSPLATSARLQIVVPSNNNGRLLLQVKGAPTLNSSINDIQTQLYVPAGSGVRTIIEVALGSIPLPHQIQVALRQDDATTPTAEVQLRVTVLSFTDDV